MDATQTASTEDLTEDMITELRDEAGAAGDDAMLHVCNVASNGGPMARESCAQAISNARAQDDSKPFVRVIP